MLTTLGNAKAWLSLTSATDDALLTRLIQAASGLIESYCNRQFASQSYTETRDGNGRPILLLGNYPISAVSSVSVNGRPIPQAGAFGVPGYRFNSDSILLTGYLFERGLKNIDISYTAGLATIPPEIEQACIELVALRYKERDRIGHVSKSLAGETVTFFVGDMPASVKTTLGQYKRVAPL